MLGIFQSFNYFDIPKKFGNTNFHSLTYTQSEKEKKIETRCSSRCTVHLPTDPRKNSLFLFLSLGRIVLFFKSNHRLIFVPASEKERENRRGLRNETREERRMIVKRSRHLVHNLTLFFSTYT